LARGGDVAAHRAAVAVLNLSGWPRSGLFGVNWNGVLAGAMFNALPIILLVIFRRYFIRSAASSAVKG
jgi:ABC-type glycerol-3-phosphate transport system permease component